MGRRDFFHFVARLGQADVEHLLPGPRARDQELQRQRRFSGSRLPLQKIKSARRQPAFEDVIESGNAGRDFRVIRRRRFSHRRGIL